MASAATETSPLLPTAQTPNVQPPPRPQRTVTFNPESTSDPPARIPIPGLPTLRPMPTPSPSSLSPQFAGAAPTLTNFNNRFRRRNSHGSPLSAPPMTQTSAPKIGPQRTTKNAQKLKLLPNPDPGEDGPDEESGRDVYSQFTRIKDPTARRDAARLGKADRDRLPRVTAYCTAGSYRLESLMKFLKARARTRGATPKQFDECIYSPFNYGNSKKGRGGSVDMVNGKTDQASQQGMRERRHSDSILEMDDSKSQFRERLSDLRIEAGDINGESSIIDSDGLTHLLPLQDDPLVEDFDTQVHTPEVFLFEYGTVVIWGMTLIQEQRFLKDLAKFEEEKLSEDDVQTENFNFYYTREYQARIYNDFISLREKKNYMTKLAISHALAQSVKTSLFEDLLSDTISQTTPLPAQLAQKGSISLSRLAINKKIGDLFILRINIHLQGSVLDAPELMWAEPQLEPIYQAVRSYLEMDQRVGLMTERLDVLGDLLAVLKDQVRTSHGEYLEWIVIILIAAEIAVAAVNIIVDLYAGVD
ncbi:MAG: hypothetical protein MMC33_002003 [Icmadophila ericetorum]|nr:hypothetical protein [Icmadophila ericetorum]